jgi:hypothetical protein
MVDVNFHDENQQVIELEDADGPTLAEHAAAIHTLGRRVVGDVIEIGRRLTECKRIFGHGNFLPWLDREFGWSDKTAENFINVYKLSSKFENFSNLSLPLSALYLLAAPSTPDEVRTQIITRAEAGEVLPAAEVKQTIDTAKARKPRNLPRAEIHRGMKLGEGVIKKLESTSLGNARELDELIFLNRGTPKGELNPTVTRLIEEAMAGKDVSAVRDGRERLREDILARNGDHDGGHGGDGDRGGIHDHGQHHGNGDDAAAETVTGDDPGPMPDCLRREPEVLSSLEGDVGANSVSELERKLARLEELECEKRQWEIQRHGYVSEVQELQAKLGPQTEICHARRIFRQAIGALQKSEVPKILEKDRRALRNSAVTDLLELIRSIVRDGLKVERLDLTYRSELH